MSFDKQPNPGKFADDPQHHGRDRGRRLSTPGLTHRHHHHNNNNHPSMVGNCKEDDPPNSRLFIVCSKQVSEDDFREAFQEFGTIEEVWVLKDKVTGANKGVVYVKFAKTSEAARAMEEMNGKCVGNCPRPLKVLIAHARDQGSRREVNEDERLLRLFVVVPKEMKESEIREHFAAFGGIDYVSVVKDRTNKEGKGFAYVKYHRVSHAARAFEDCDRSFKAVFAEPRPVSASSSKGDRGDSGGRPHRSHGGSNQQQQLYCDLVSSRDSLLDFHHHQSQPGLMVGQQQHQQHLIMASVAGSVSQDLVWRLFDIVPGLESCDRVNSHFHNMIKSGLRHPNTNSNFSTYCVTYNDPKATVYARDKLDGFEYPPGQRIRVTLIQPSLSNRSSTSSGSSCSSSGGGGLNVALPPARDMAASLMTETMIANAAAVLQAARYHQSPSSSSSLPEGNSQRLPSSSPPDQDTYDPSYCSVRLPPPQPLAPMDRPVEERLFLVFLPAPPPVYALRDVFGRFGHLVDVYVLNNRNCGYAKYSNKESAERAVKTLHGQDVCGSRLKVMLAEPQGRSDAGERKRAKFDD